MRLDVLHFCHVFADLRQLLHCQKVFTRQLHVTLECKLFEDVMPAFDNGVVFLVPYCRYVFSCSFKLSGLFLL